MTAGIYLDHNATTPIDPAVIDAMTRVLRDGHANPESQHQPGRKARRVLEAAREAIAAMLGAKTTGMDADRLIFTSGGTEANNAALSGLAAERPGPIVISSVEHPSILRVAEALERQGRRIVRLRALPNGCLDTSTLADQITAEVAVVCVMTANNETGAIQPLDVVARRCREVDVPLLTDAVQAVGKMPVHFRTGEASALTVAPHKFHGPVGIGGLLVRSGVKLQPLLHGGFQQAGLRPGTESVAAAVGFQVALEIALRDYDERTRRMGQLRDALEQRLTAADPSAIVIAGDAPRLPSTLNIAFPGVDRQALVMALDLAGVACSTGSACASGSSEPSPVLLAMGLPTAVVEASLRFSLGAFTTAADIADASERILKAVNQLRTAKTGENRPVVGRVEI